MTVETVADDRAAMLDAFATSADELLAAEDHRKRRRLLGGTERSHDAAMWRRLADAGWFAALVPEDLGGLGLGLDAAAVLAEAAGSHLLPEPFVASAAQCAVVLAHCPPGPQRNELFAELVSGRTVLACAWQEDTGELEPDPRQVKLDHRSGNDVLHGTKLYVEPGDGAGGWIVLARRGPEAALVWVRADSRGVELSLERRIDGARWATLRFDQVPVRPQDVVATGQAALDAVAAGLRATRILQAAELVGLSQRALALSLDYVRTRTQFGKPIGSFQALQHRLVDAALQLELARASLREALSRCTDERHLAEFADRTKARAALAALSITRLAIQLHGALGITHECDIGHYFTRALSLNAALGTQRVLRNRWSRRDHGHDPDDEVEHAPPADPDRVDCNTLSDAQVRRIYREFLEAHYPQQHRHLPLQYVHLDQIRDWNRILYERGWRAPAWPREYGGLGLSRAKLIALHEEKERYGVARWTDQGCEMLGPVLIRYGTDEQRRTWLPKILSGEHAWCQGYSEPNAGSDLASLRTTAELDGDEFVVNGRKIWTSYAHESTHIFMLVRTDRSAKPAAGISFLLASMDTPGITLRPIADLTGDESFCEVQFDNVRVPRANLVGELNQGWTIAKSLLGHERLFIGNPATVNHLLRQLRQLAEERGLFADDAFRERYAEIELDIADLNSLYARFADLARRGAEMPPEVSMLKIYCTETWQRVSALLYETAAEQGACLAAQSIGGQRMHLLTPLFNALPGSIYGGSNEIQRNILARQVLGLPT